MTRLLGSDAAKLKTTPRVRMLTDSEVNAFALPEGSIYVFSGLLTTLASEDQLAAVLSHEIAHYTHRHAVRAQRQAVNDRRRIEALSAAKGMTVMFGMAATGIHPGEQTLRALSDLDRVWLAAAWGGYSRELEREADDAGFERAVPRATTRRTPAAGSAARAGTGAAPPTRCRSCWSRCPRRTTRSSSRSSPTSRRFRSTRTEGSA